MNRDELLNQQLSLVKPYVDTIRVCDGAGNDSTKDICKEFNAKYYYRQWDDNFAAQDNVLFSKAKNKEWILVMDSDELPSVELLKNLRLLAKEKRHQTYNCVRIPAITVLDGIPECTVQDRIRDTIEKCDIFRKDWFFQYVKGVHATGSPHRGFHHPNDWIYHDTGYPYYHIKNTDDFIINDCLHAFINPEGQVYSAEEKAEFTSCECIKRLECSTEVLPMLESDSITEDFIQFIWKYKDEDKPISRWFWLYYFMYHEEELPEDFDWVNDISYRNFLNHKRGYNSWERFREYK